MSRWDNASAIGTAFKGNTNIVNADFSIFPNITTVNVVGCSSLVSLTLPKNQTSTGSGFFEGCTALKRVVFGEKFTSFGYATFPGNGGQPSNCTLIFSNSLSNVDGNSLRGGSAIFVLHSDVGNYPGLKSSRMLSLYVPDEYYDNYLDYGINSSKLHKISEWVE